MWIENRLLTSKTDHLRRLLTLYDEYPASLEVDTESLRLLVGRFFSFDSLTGILATWRNVSPRVSFSVRSMSN